MVTETIHIKNMVCNCCIILLRQLLEQAGVTVNTISLGTADISYDEKKYDRDGILEFLRTNNFEPVTDREKIIVESIKASVIELIHHLNNVDSIVRKSDYLVEKLGMSYQYLSKLFSKHEPVTLEKYIILNKIERIKEMINHGELTLSEIAYMMDYNSVQYLSNQFKKITGISVSDYKKSGNKNKKTLDKLC
ncbi:MAG: AraC family transcriptional regulator [Bacteroidales bacterium]|nr:AraC family transcriptional regulator [Bacteroidales bacterium]